MVKVSFKYTPALVEWIKQAAPGSRWNPNEKVWDIPDSLLDELRMKAEGMGVEVKVSGEVASALQPKPATAAQAYSKQQVERMGYMEWDEQHSKGSTFRAREGDIELTRSKDGRYVLIRINLIANTEDLQQFLVGRETSVKFRVLPPRPRPPQGGGA
jgi:hypothetical protein